MRQPTTNGRHEQTARPLLAVLTGGVASGKTTASDCFADLGVTVIDTDVIARELVAPGSQALDEIVASFGPDILTEDGTLDRRRLRRTIFADDQARRKLERILHPRIETATRKQINEAGGEPYVLVVVPLLVESGLFSDADRVIVVDVPEQVQLERLQSRDGITSEQARKMLEAQASREARLAIADEVLDNTGSPEALSGAVKHLHERLLEEVA